MIIAGREIIFKESFLDELTEFEQYLGRVTRAKGRTFTTAIFDFCCDIVAIQPLAYPVFQHKRALDAEVRWAVFQRKHAMLYRVSADAVRFISLYHTSQNEADLLFSLD